MGISEGIKGERCREFKGNDARYIHDEF
jgi:hypothetical protein